MRITKWQDIPSEGLVKHRQRRALNGASWLGRREEGGAGSISFSRRESLSLPAPVRNRKEKAEHLLLIPPTHLLPCCYKTPAPTPSSHQSNTTVRARKSHTSFRPFQGESGPTKVPISRAPEAQEGTKTKANRKFSIIDPFHLVNPKRCLIHQPKNNNVPDGHVLCKHNSLS